LVQPYNEAAPAPSVIAVTLVTVPPPPPPPAPVQQQPKPKPEPQQEQKPLAYRESGPDQRTTQAPRAEEKAPEPSAPPKSTDTETKPAEQPTSAAPTKEGFEPPPEKPHPAAPSQPAPEKPKLVLRAPKVEPPIDDRMLGEDNESGDPYLNALWSRIEANRKPTTPIGPAGLHLAGISTYRLVLDRFGRMDQIDLLNSSGSPLLDDEAKRMIVAATPFPPLPPDYPNQIALKVTIRLYPQ
jgi:TonB family protein